MQVPDAEHDRHDTVLVAGLLDRSTDAPERRRGEMLVAGCAECAALHQDLLDLRSATRTLATPTRTRDYSLTPDDARRLRRTGWRRLVAIFGSTRDAFSRPLAIGLTTIGLVGLLVTTIPGALPGGWSTAAPSLGGAAGAGGSGATSQSLETTKAAPLPSAAPSAPGPAAAALTAPSPAPTGAAAPPAPSVAPVPSGEAFDTFIGSPEPSVGAAGIAPGPEASAPSLGAQRNGAPPDAGPTVPVDHLAAVALAGLFFAAGLGLFALRWAARRV